MNQMKLPYFVAEISANHNGSLTQARELIKTAKRNGANAVKLQTYTPATMTINSKKKILELKEDFGMETLYGIYMIRHRHHSSGIKICLIMQKK